jgi:hypothetical protein
VLEPGLYCIVVEPQDTASTSASVPLRLVATQHDGVLMPGMNVRTTCDQGPDPQTVSCAAPANPRAVFLGFALCPNTSYSASFQLMSSEFQAAIALRGLSPFGGQLDGVCAGGACCKTLSSVPGGVQLDATLVGSGPFFAVVERAASQPDCGTFVLSASITPM